jgi:hypothetical protein
MRPIAVKPACSGPALAHAGGAGTDVAAIGVRGCALRRLRQHESRLGGTRRAGEAGCAREPVRRRATGGFRRGPRFRQHLLQGSKQKIMDSARIAKSHFQFLRMRIDVDPARIHLQVQQVGAKSAMKQHVAISQARGAHQDFVAHEAPIQKAELQVRLAARKGRQRQPSRQAQGFRVMAQFDHMGGEILAANSGNAPQPLEVAGRCRQRPDVLAVVHEAERHVKTRQGHSFQHAHDMLTLGVLGAQEFAPRRHIEK